MRGTPLPMFRGLAFSGRFAAVAVVFCLLAAQAPSFAQVPVPPAPAAPGTMPALPAYPAYGQPAPPAYAPAPYRYPGSRYAAPQPKLPRVQQGGYALRMSPPAAMPPAAAFEIPPTEAMGQIRLGPPPPGLAQPGAPAKSVATLSPSTAMPPSATTTVDPNLPALKAVRFERGEMRILGEANRPMIVQKQFMLNAPNRFVMDLEGVRLGDATFPPFPAEIDGVPVKGIRFGQFTGDIVRVVIETPEPDRLRFSVRGNEIAISGRRGLFGSIFHGIFGPSDSNNAKPIPSRTGSPKTAPAPSQNPATVMMPPMPVPQFYGTLTERRSLVLEKARTQLGLSKDANRDFINQTFSQGRDQAWCADFVSTVLDWSGGSPWGHYSRVQDIYEWGLKNNRMTMRVAPADLVVFSYRNSSFDHIAFVESFDPQSGTITTIGGNEGYAASGYKTSGTVARSTYKIDDKRILGFIDPLL